ncbi:MAG: Hsp20/alpha crystallin family protein [Promethearchaeota archaeon]|nr:MAG: Hsp20/alpha crystallin family protein [Candidatus Lokiarchaeota archaeon]
MEGNSMAEKIDVKKEEPIKEENEENKKSRELTIRRENPFSLFQEMDRMFDDMFNDSFFWPFNRRRYRPLSLVIRDDEPLFRTPLANIKDLDNHYEISAELPGLDRDNIELTLREGMMEIKGEHKEEHKEEKEGQLVRREYQSSSYYRCFNLPENIDVDNIDANLEKGILTVKIPKLEPPKPETKKIEVK